ncbi:chaperone protein dnaJ 20, chloroplastic-like [Oryza brachyantha]|uniref:chaperone protein dnaJ 20, chloroplastic-like n=1 Tax=Oryza brachyantha TaxID=4533 RepID=UPI001ADD585F|nr:chaperone protein dnaJ 20, chloroplastic-like [Oryza brachyantha]
MSSACARPVGVGYLGGGGGAASWCQQHQRPRRAWASVRARASAAAVAPPTERAVTMYEVLAVEETAGPEEIKAAYRRAARRWHPDACPGGADRFMLAREAYEVLSDPERRRGYDIQLRCGAGAGPQAARRAGFADWEAQLAGLQWRAASRETWGSRMRHAAARAQPSPL